MQKTSLAFRVAAWWAGIYHLTLALIGIFAGTATLKFLIKEVFHADIEVTPQVFFLIKFCSAYMLAFAIATLLLARDPLRYRQLVWAPLTLFFVRFIQSAIFADERLEAFSMLRGEQFVNAAICLVLFSILFFCRPKEPAR